MLLSSIIKRFLIRVLFQEEHASTSGMLRHVHTCMQSGNLLLIFAAPELNSECWLGLNRAKAAWQDYRTRLF